VNCWLEGRLRVIVTCQRNVTSDKTFIGRIERGFDFLGYRFSPAGLTLAKQTIANFIEKASRLYEQKRRAVSAATALLPMRASKVHALADGLCLLPKPKI
jgi:hypothetical protein